MSNKQEMATGDDVFVPFLTQIEKFLDENCQLDPEYRIPLESFALNASKLESLKKQLREREESIIQNMEKDRLRKQLNCHFLKEAAWNNFRTTAATLCSLSGLLTVQNYPIFTSIPSKEHTRFLTERLITLSSERDQNGPQEPQKELKFAWKNFRHLPTHSILHSQYELQNDRNISQQIMYLEVISVRLMEEFNDTFESKRSKKGSLLKEMTQLLMQLRYLKEEIEKLEEANRSSDLEDHRSSSLRSQSKSDEEFEVPQWFPEELPERLLYLEEEEVEKIKNKMAADALPHPADSRLKDVDCLSTTSSKGEEKLTFVSSRRQPPTRMLSHEMYGGKESPWPWIELQEKRMQEIMQEKEKRRCIANAKNLQLQLQRSKPTIENLLKELDSEIFSLSFQKILTFQKIQIISTMTCRLEDRLFQKKVIQEKLSNVTKRYEELQKEEMGVAERTDMLFHREGKNKLKLETLAKSLKEDDATVQRAFINLPVDQYKYLLEMYRDSSGVKAPSSKKNSLFQVDSKERKSFSEEEPSKIEIGKRTWRQYLKFKKRKQDIEKELEETKAGHVDIMNKLAMKANEKLVITEQKMEAEASMKDFEQEISTVGEDLELFLLLPGKRVMVDIENMVDSLSPNFAIGKLITRYELEASEKKAGMTIKESNPIEDASKIALRMSESLALLEEESDVLDVSLKKSDVTEARKERDRLLLQVELAEDRLKQIMQLKFGQKLQMTKVKRMQSQEDDKSGGKRDPSDIYDTVINLQKLQEVDSRIARDRISKKGRRIRFSRMQIQSLQKEIDEISEEIEDLHSQQSVKAKREEAIKEERLRQIMAVQRYSEALKTKKKDMIDLEKSLRDLLAKSYPKLPDN